MPIASNQHQLLPLLLLALGQLTGRAEAILWSRALQTELATRSFGGIRLCAAATQSQSVNITALDLYSVPALGLSPGLVYTVRSQFTLYVLACLLPPSPDGTYTYLRAFLLSEVQWDDVCANTVNLTIFMSSSVSSDTLSYTVQPCNYTVQHEGTTTQQITAWILFTYSADWSPDWVNRTYDSPDSGIGAATVVLRSDANSSSQLNATWRYVLTSGLPALPMTPGQKVQAALASVSTSQSWWLLICSVLNASQNLLVSVGSCGTNETLESYMNCSARTALVWGAPNPLGAAAESASKKPLIEAGSGGYWGRELQRQLTTQLFGGLAFCAAANASAGSGILVTATDDIVASPAGDTVVRGTFDTRVVPCSTAASSALGDAYLKALLRTEANWTDVCANSADPVVRVNLADRTAVEFRPCPQSDAALRDPGATASKSAWCLLALNTSSLELEWISRESATLVEPSAASVTFRVFGEANGTVALWSNVLVNGLTTGDQVDRLVQVFKMVDTAYWPVICQLVNASVDSFLSIQVVGNSSRTASLYTNCSGASELSSTPPDYLTTAEASATSPGVSSTTTPTTTTTTTTTPTTTTTTTTTPATTTTTTTTTTTPTTKTTTTASTTTTTTPTTATTTTTTTPTTTKETSTITTTTPTTTTITSTTPESTSTGVATPSPEELKAIQAKQNLDAITAQKQQYEFGTQIAVISAALLVLLVLGTLGICKMVVPRAA